MGPSVNSSAQAKALADEICRALSEHGNQAYLVGGCVRDLLLKRQPADYDVATDATPDQVEELFPNSVLVGAQFGVVIVVRDGLQVEVATFRSDVGYSDGRHPDNVIFAKTPQEDVARRDFTINGMMMNPATGEVLDFVGGSADLRAGIIRTIGNAAERFREDKLRLVRAIRFASRFGYGIELRTLLAIRQFAPQITTVSAERLRDELTKLLTEGAARRAFELLDETGLLEPLLPEVARLKGVEQPPQFHPEGDVWIHTLLMLEKLSALPPEARTMTLAWGVLLHDIGKPATFRSAAQTGDRIRFDGHAEMGVRVAEEVCHRFRFSNEETEQVVSLVANHMRFKDVPQMRASTLKRFVRLPKFEEHLELHRIDCLSSHGHVENWEYAQEFIAKTPAEEVHPARLVTGDDLLEMGFLPGPEFKTILQAVEDAQLEGLLRTREEALAYVRKEFAG
jgi:poly(A) polymerase